jgi:Bacteriophage probable baseplate hub protein
MDLTYAPQYRITANSNDITAVIKERFMSLRLTDEAGMDSDMLEITLADHDPANPIEIPPKGAELELFLGYNGNTQRMGLYVVDEFELAGWPGSLVIRAKATPFTQSKGGKKSLQTQKTRSWPLNTTLGALVSKIASDNGMQPAVSSSLSSISLPHIDQTDESDLNLLVRTARKFDAVVKPSGGKLVVAKKGEAKAVASGNNLPDVTLTPGDIESWRVVMSSRESAGQVTAYYHDLNGAQRHAVTVGSGDPERKLRMTYPTQALALAAARADLNRRTRGEMTLALHMAGRPDIMAEADLTLSGFRVGVPEDWTITSVTHNLDDGGYSIDVEAELPNSSDTPNSEDDAE